MNAAAWFYGQSFNGGSRERQQVSVREQAHGQPSPTSVVTVATLPAEQLPSGWPSKHYGCIRGTLLSLGWKESGYRFTKSPYWTVEVGAKWELIEECDFEFSVLRAHGETRDELETALMERGLMRWPDEDGERFYQADLQANMQEGR